MEGLEKVSHIYNDILNFSGINILMKTPKPIEDWRKMVFSFFMMVTIISIFVLTYSSFMAESGFNDFVYNFCNWIQQLQLAIKVYYFYRVRNSLEKIMIRFDEMKSCLKEPEFASEFFNKRTAIVKRLNKIYYVATWLTCALYTCIPPLKIMFLTLNPEQVQKILPTIYPFDVSQNPVYSIVYLYEFIVCISISTLLPGIDIFFLTVGYLICAQFKFLGRFLSEVGPQGTDVPPKDHWKLDIKSFVQDHLIILEMSNNLRRIVSPLLIFQLTVSLTTFSLNIYRLTYISTTTDSIYYYEDGAKATMYFVTTFIQFAPYCWLSSELQNANENLCTTVYSSDWYMKSKDFKICTQMIIYQQNRDLTLDAMKMLKVNLNTIIDILKLSYSYYTILSQISKD